MGLLVLAACSGGGAPPQPTATATPSPTSTPQLRISCAAIQSVSSYRYTIRLQLDIPGFQATNGDEEPLGQFAEPLLGLLSDFHVEGAFVAPDRSQMLLSFQDQELEVRNIGDRGWLRLGDVWQEEATPPADGGLLSPKTICDELLPDFGQTLEDTSFRKETVNGINTRHYHLDAADLQRLAALLDPGEDGELPKQFTVDIWLAEDGGWPVKLQLTASNTDEAGQPVSLDLFMEFRDINDPSIEIEPPQIEGGQA